MNKGSLNSTEVRKERGEAKVIILIRWEPSRKTVEVKGSLNSTEVRKERGEANSLSKNDRNPYEKIRHLRRD